MLTTVAPPMSDPANPAMWWATEIREAILMNFLTWYCQLKKKKTTTEDAVMSVNVEENVSSLVCIPPFAGFTISLSPS